MINNKCLVYSSAFLLFCCYFVLFREVGGSAVERGAYYDYNDYYDDYYDYEPTPAPRRHRNRFRNQRIRQRQRQRPLQQQQQQERQQDLNEDQGQDNLAELVKAWKEFISGKNQVSGGRRHNNRPTTTTTTEPPYECPPRDESYYTADEEQCDKYTECNIKGEKKEKLCPDGFMFDIRGEHCDYPSKVNCTGRPKLQEPQPSKHCPRANGFFPFPANESCQKFYDCRGGTGYLQECPKGVIFDPKIAACTTPDQSDRKECEAGSFLGFKCPVYGLEEELRFGDHERMAHPDDCQQYFSCLRNGRPRQGACPKKTVFSPETGQCAQPAKVPGCENYWVEKLKEEEQAQFDYDYY